LENYGILSIVLTEATAKKYKMNYLNDSSDFVTDIPWRLSLTVEIKRSMYLIESTDYIYLISSNIKINPTLFTFTSCISVHFYTFLHFWVIFVHFLHFLVIFYSLLHIWVIFAHFLVRLNAPEFFSTGFEQERDIAIAFKRYSLPQIFFIG
jgi:hypothetical protein